MRWLFFVLILSACDISQSDSSDAGADASRPCDNKSDCAACQACAMQQACATLLSACYNNSVCWGLKQCVDGCGADLPCKQECYSNNAGGVSLYEAYLNCVLCNQCPSDCAGYRSCT